MSEEMRRDPAVFFMGEDIGVYGGAFGVSVGMIDEFGPDRVRDTPISEAVIVGAAAGAAATGTRPIAEIQFSDFLGIGIDQLANQAAKMRYMFGGNASVPMVIRAPAGSGTGAAAQHSQSQEAWYCHIPGIKVVTPSTPYDAKGLLVSAIRDNNPVVFLEQKLLYRQSGPVPEGDYTVPLCVSETKRPGRDMTVITWGRMVSMVLEVAQKLSSERGMEIEVIDPRTLMPLDAGPIIASVKRTGRAMIVHEAVRTAGYGGEIAATIADSEAFFYLDAPIRRVAGLDVPIPYNPHLERNAVPTAESIESNILELLE